MTTTKWFAHIYIYTKTDFMRSHYSKLVLCITFMNRFLCGDDRATRPLFIAQVYHMTTWVNRHSIRQNGLEGAFSMATRNIRYILVLMLLIYCKIFASYSMQITCWVFHNFHCRKQYTKHRLSCPGIDVTASCAHLGEHTRCNHNYYIGAILPNWWNVGIMQQHIWE